MPDITVLMIYFVLFVILVSMQLTLNKILVILKDINSKLKESNDHCEGVKK